MANIFNTGISSLLASQKALATTAHNIANANTEGYSRQRITQETRPTTSTGNGFIGNGVQVKSVDRINSEFIQAQFQETTSDQQRVETYYQMMSRVDVMLAETNSGLSTVQSDFFNSLQDLNTNPTSVGARQSVLNSAANLTDRFNGIQSQFDSLQQETNNRLGGVVNDINSIAENIALLNYKISAATAASQGAQPNDLLDQRDNQLNELSKLVANSTFTGEDGSLNVFIGNGLSLVSGGSVMRISEVRDDNFPDTTQIQVESSSGSRIVTDQLTGGALGGLLDFRDNAMASSMNEIGRLAIVLADQFNAQHSEGLTLEGNQGADFFTIPTGTAVSNVNNTGTASAAINFVDTTQLTTSDYSVRFDGTDYTLTRLSDDSSVTGGSPLVMDGIEVTLSGTANAGDQFLILPTRGAAGNIGKSITSTNDIALSAPIRSESKVSNLGSADIQFPSVIDSTNANLTNSVEIQFATPASTYDVIDTTTGTTLSSGTPYTNGDAISYNGWQVEINGTPESGDVFTVSINADSTGNNRNGQLLSDIQNALLIDGTANLLDGYGAFVGQVGSNTRQAQINSEAMDSLLQQTWESRESISGVNLDEEAINLTRQQQSYQASAQIISAAEDMFQTLINAIG